MIGWLAPRKRETGPRSAEGHADAPEAVRGAEDGTEALWCVQWPGGRDWRATEREAESLADWLVKSRAVEVVAVFEVLVESEGDAA